MRGGLLIGLAAGVITATVLFHKSQNLKVEKRSKSAILKRIEDILD